MRLMSGTLLHAPGMSTAAEHSKLAPIGRQSPLPSSEFEQVVIVLVADMGIRALRSVCTHSRAQGSSALLNCSNT